jgi:hypothetical protein
VVKTVGTFFWFQAPCGLQTEAAGFSKTFVSTEKSTWLLNSKQYHLIVHLEFTLLAYNCFFPGLATFCVGDQRFNRHCNFYDHLYSHTHVCVYIYIYIYIYIAALWVIAQCSILAVYRSLGGRHSLNFRAE